MAYKVIEAEADTLEEAREGIKSQTPEEFRLLWQEVISDGKPVTVKAVAGTTEAAFADAKRGIPKDAHIREQRVLIPDGHVERTVIAVEAFDEQTANANARAEASKQCGSAAVVQSLKMAIPGKKGVLGMGKKPDQYEAEVAVPRQPAVEITYTQKARISAVVGDGVARDVDPEVARVLTALESTDEGVQMMAIRQATPLVMKNAQGALEPFLIALRDKPRLRPMALAELNKVPDYTLREALSTSGLRDEWTRALQAETDRLDELKRELLGQKVQRERDLPKYEMHYYLQTTIEVEKSVQDQIVGDGLKHIHQEKPQFIGAAVGKGEAGVGPVDASSVGVALVILLVKNNIEVSDQDQIASVQGRSADPRGTSFDWLLNVCFVLR